jgi:hypothetical protein
MAGVTETLISIRFQPLLPYPAAAIIDGLLNTLFAPINNTDSTPSARPC